MSHSCRTLLRVPSSFLLGVFSWCGLKLYLQVTGVEWYISHQTQASGRKVFQGLNICSIQSAAPSFLTGNLRNSKVLLSEWPEILFVWAKKMSGSAETKFPVLGQFSQVSWLKEKHQGSLEASVQQPCQGVSSKCAHCTCPVKLRPPVGTRRGRRGRRGLLAGEVLICEEFWKFLILV